MIFTISNQAKKTDEAKSASHSFVLTKLLGVLIVLNTSMQ